MRRTLVALFSLMLTAPTFGQVPSKGGTYRPVIRGTRAVVAGGQPLTVEAGLRMLHDLHDELATRGSRLRIVGAHGSSRDRLRADGIEEKVGGLDRTATVASVLLNGAT